MGKNSDFIHSYVPWMSFQRDRFKYHLKYKKRKDFWKEKKQQSFGQSQHSARIPMSDAFKAFITDSGGALMQLTMQMYIKDWKSVWNGKKIVQH